MELAGTIIKGIYYDSVTLMRAARELQALPEVTDAAAVMATAENKRILAASGLDWPDLADAGDTDLVLAVTATDAATAKAALEQAQDNLTKQSRRPAGTQAAEYAPRSLEKALEIDPSANFALISVAGKYAATEIRKALQAGLNVLCFSDNVTLEDEVACKQYARAQGRLLMGPDCGTALVGGVPLAFANEIRSGGIGLVAASGTGLQEVTCLIHRAGGGVSHALGVGGRDVKAPVGGLSLLTAWAALEQDEATRVIVWISKTPDPSVLQNFRTALRTASKPVVACFIGADPDALEGTGVHAARTLEDAALQAVALDQNKDLDQIRSSLATGTNLSAPQRRPGGRYVRGLFCGGTFAQEAVHLLGARLDAIQTNVREPLADPDRSQGHSLIDLGSDEFTAGRAHPMIDYALRNRRILEEARDPETAVIWVDVVLGYGAHPEPAAELVPVFESVRALDNPPPIVFHVCGTDDDPQHRARVVAALTAAGGWCAPSNAAAAAWIADLLELPQTGPAAQAAAIMAATENEAEPFTLNPPTDLLTVPLRVINVGLADFAGPIRARGHSCIQVDWQPPAPVAPEVLAHLQSAATERAAANARAFELVQQGQPYWVDMGIARDLVPDMHPNRFLHAGPPIEWERMCGPLRGALIGAVLYEGYADNVEEAAQQLAAGRYEFAPCHGHQTVGPMAGVVSPSMPVFVVENRAHGNRTYCTQNEGLGKVLRYGAYAPEVLERLRWMATTLYPALQAAIRSLDGIDLNTLIAQALHMGDEVHNRNRAATSLLLRALVPALVRTAPDAATAAAAIEFINGNDHFFLNLSMPACKAVLDPARNIPHSSLVVAMARNGTDFGIQLAGTGDRWFTGPALVPDALYFAGYSKDDANPDIGDSCITEAGGLGGFAIAAAPAIVQFVGGHAADALRYTLEMYEIVVGENKRYQIPSLDFRGTPTGIDAIRVVEKGIVPFIDTGVAHKEAGVGQVGAGVVSAPMEPFIKAVEGLAATQKEKEQ